jgi:hypothetical protein
MSVRSDGILIDRPVVTGRPNGGIEGGRAELLAVERVRLVGVVDELVAVAARCSRDRVPLDGEGGRLSGRRLRRRRAGVRPARSAHPSGPSVRRRAGRGRAVVRPLPSVSPRVP